MIYVPDTELQNKIHKSNKERLERRTWTKGNMEKVDYPVDVQYNVIMFWAQHLPI